MQETMFTGIYDENCSKIHVGDKVKLFDWIGEVVFECGAFGIAFQDVIDWDYIEKQIPIVTGCNNRLCACQNDNFVSLWELMWNFNCEDNSCDVLTVLQGGAK